MPAGLTLALFVLLSLASAAFGQPTPATLPTPLTYEEIVDRAAKASQELDEVEQATQARLKELSGVEGKESDEARRDLLIKRRLVDRQAWIATRRLKVYWLEQSLAPEQRAILGELGDEELTALLDARSVEQRLAVPLPPKRFKDTSVEDVLHFISDKIDVQIVADWPALTKVGVSKIDVVTIDIGGYDRPAVETLKAVLSAVGQNLTVLDLSFPDTALVSTGEGLERIKTLDGLLAGRVRDAAVWTRSPIRQPGSLTEVPLQEALDVAVGGELLLEVQWERLAEIGIGPQTPVSLTLGVHRVGHALAGIADVLGQSPQNVRRAAVVFDRTAEGVTVVSTAAGLKESLAAAGRLATAVQKDQAMSAAIAVRIPEVNLDRVRLGEIVATVEKEAAVTLRVDWISLNRSGLDQATAVTMHLIDAPLSQVLRLMFATPPGTPPVIWAVQDGQLVVMSSSP